MKKIASVGICLTLVASFIASDIVLAAPEAIAPAEKQDEILVETDASGNITKKTANVTITASDSSSPIRDKSVLSDIKNVSGDEGFSKDENGTVIWDNSGNDINYTGSFTEELPFSMTIDYYLNGQKIEAEDLAGQSGHVEVIYSFENRAQIDVEVDGDTISTYVPFLAVTTISLPMDDFTNVESLDGGLVVEEFGDTYFMLGVATPGVNEALNLEIMGLDQYIHFPESFGFSADVVNFEMPSTITSVTPHALDKLDLSQIKTTDNVNDQINELISATQQLVDGSDELAGGTEQLSDGVGTFISEFQKGLKEISDGTAQFNNDLYDLEAKKNMIKGEAGELLEYLDSVIAQLNGFELPTSDSIFPSELIEAEAKLKEDAILLINALETMKSQLEEIQAFAEEAEAYVDEMTVIGNTVYEELSAIDLDQIIEDATALAKEQATAAAKEELAGLPISDEQIETIIANIMSKVDISSVADEARIHIAKVKEVLSDIPEIVIPEFQVDVDPVIEILQDMEVQFIVLEEASAKQDEMTELLTSAESFLTSVKDSSSVLRKKSTELISGLDFADSAIKNAQNYINSLKTAVAEAGNGSTQLADGVSQVENGAKQLADGTEQYYTEGIMSAADYARQATLRAFVSRCKSFVYAAREYTNITGIESGTEGNVRFMIQTSDISASK